MNNSELLPYDAFFSKLRNVNSLEKEKSDYQKLLSSGLKTEKALSKMKLSKPPPSGEENYQYLFDGVMRICAHLKTFYAATTTKKLSQHSKQCKKYLFFCHKKQIDMLKLGCTLQKLTNICLHKSTSAEFYAFTETDKDLLQKIREDMVGGPSVVFTRKSVVDETFIRNSRSFCQSIVSIDASQLYPYSTCQPMPTGLYTQ